jgi:hypothetical protein
MLKGSILEDIIIYHTKPGRKNNEIHNKYFPTASPKLMDKPSTSFTTSVVPKCKDISAVTL